MQAKNVILFVCDRALLELYWDRIHKYLQPHEVKWAFSVATAQELSEVSRGSPGSWDVILVDSTVLRQNEDSLKTFLAANPRVVVGVLYEANPPSKLALSNATAFETPSDVDDWLVMMHRLLGAE
ncbi:MAG: hypothetical protein HYY04_09560 [Chloroflexi bacterium]|nr:hypothetical protein [Chloroflexota bacterium]